MIQRVKCAHCRREFAWNDITPRICNRCFLAGVDGQAEQLRDEAAEAKQAGIKASMNAVPQGFRVRLSDGQAECNEAAKRDLAECLEKHFEKCPHAARGNTREDAHRIVFDHSAQRKVWQRLGRILKQDGLGLDHVDEDGFMVFLPLRVAAAKRRRKVA